MRHPGNSAPKPHISAETTIEGSGATLYTLTFKMHGPDNTICTVTARRPVSQPVVIVSIVRAPMLEGDDPYITDEWITEAALEYIEDSGL